MFQHGQHPVFSTQAIIHREVTPQLPEFHHKYLILQLSSQDWPPITDFGKWEESDVWNVCRVWIWSSSLPMTPQSSKINWLALGALLVAIQPQTVGSSGSLFSTLSFQSSRVSQNSATHYLRSSVVKYSVSELQNLNCHISWKHDVV